MKICPPPPNIELYSDGFNRHDALDRRVAGEKLSQLIERVEDPLVIAIDGKWGSGKSFFLKCWVGAHQKENGGNAQTVYFDAFENDFLNDPLISLTGAIARRFEQQGMETAKIARIRTIASKLVKPGSRILLSAVSSGLAGISGPVLDAIISQGKEEAQKSMDDLWAAERSQADAMAAFRESLAALTRPKSEESSDRKIVIAVDELDRCRPDYALEVLETIKHFFFVPNVYFVLGVNLDELTSSIRNRYGMGTNAGLYLQKFINLTMRLSESYGPGDRSRVWQAYLDHLTQVMELDPKLSDILKTILSRDCFAERVSLRAVDRLATQCALVPVPQGRFDNYVIGYQVAIASLLVMKIIDPDFYSRAIRGNASLEEIKQFFSLGEQPQDWTAELLLSTWHEVFGVKRETPSGDRTRIFGTFGFDLRSNPVSSLAEKFIETFQFIE